MILDTLHMFKQILHPFDHNLRMIVQIDPLHPFLAY